jgi:hypothetical protein
VSQLITQETENRRHTITCDNQELLLSVQFVGDDLGVDGNDLLLGTECPVLLELEITNSSRQCKVPWSSAAIHSAEVSWERTVDSAEFDESTGALYSRCLLYIVSSPS